MLPTTTGFSVLAATFLTVLPGLAMGDDSRRVGRYLDKSVLVHEAAQLNPLEQVAHLRFSSRVTVAEALRSALTGTGYQLLDPDAHHEHSRALLESRLAIPHQNFDDKRIDSVIAAVVGAGRGFTLEVDHVARRIRVVPLGQYP